MMGHTIDACKCGLPIGHGLPHRPTDDLSLTTHPEEDASKRMTVPCRKCGAPRHIDAYCGNFPHDRVEAARELRTTLWNGNMDNPLGRISQGTPIFNRLVAMWPSGREWDE